MRARTRTVEKEVFQFDGKNQDDIFRWAQALIGPMKKGDPIPFGVDKEKHPDVLFVFSDRGVVPAYSNDWIIRGVAGEFYPCAPEVFSQSYEVLP